MPTISHMGKRFTTKHYAYLTTEECRQIRDSFWKKPELAEVQAQIKKMYAGGSRMNHIYGYYFYHLMADCRLKGHKWTIKEFMQSDYLIRFAIGKATAFPKIYAFDHAKNLKTLFRLSPSGTAAKLSNFPYKPVQEILQNYNVNNNYYDFSCGWGVRLMAALCQDVNYFGTDPNAALCDNLNDLVSEFKTQTATTSQVDIRCQGSETFVPEWENTMGVAFSSPPYFDLEVYSESDSAGQSTNLGSYQAWLEHYLEPTIDNISRYLIDEGYFLFNIKNIKDHNLYDDSKALIESRGFVLEKELDLKNTNRIILQQNDKDNNERIMVFRKQR